MTFVNNNTDGSCSPFASATVINLPLCLNLCITSPDCLGVSYNTDTKSSTAHDAFSTATDVSFATDTFPTSSLYTEYLGGSNSVQSDTTYASEFTSFEVTSSYSHIAYTSVLTTDFQESFMAPTTSSPGAVASLESSEPSTVSSDITSSPLESSETFALFPATSSSPLTSSEPVTVSPTTELLAVSSAIVTSPLSLSVTSSTSSAVPTFTVQALSSCSEVPVNVTLPKGPQVKWEEVLAFRDTVMRGELFNDVVQSTIHCAVRCSESDVCRSFFIRMSSGECYGHSESSAQCSVNMTFSAPGFRYYTFTSVTV
ncbi:uncharacterized serine-rich protein C215.13-like [Mizuhopecten yessoensis]|uniref:uncharacterized serine-rich protein C215.13-like n=1 Tax=Mizuhopecten yessoensis TaxID=6573 RepID=UPI000B45E22F|nr:uncharacterized serine-rich protein C215.13-like [Mizuhopecten yessoensis]